MSTPALKYFDILSARAAYAEGRNVTDVLRQQLESQVNTPAIIEAAYDLQAGTYIDYFYAHESRERAYATELSGILNCYVVGADSLLDVGTGEMTTLSNIVGSLKHVPTHLYALDLSWSRLHKGRNFVRQHMGDHVSKLRPFVADMSEIPLADRSISITTSSHALEPNGGRLEILLRELFRVTRDLLVLFEPGYEINSPEGKARMDRLGYIKNMPETVAALGGTMLETIRINSIDNPLNPTVSYVIKPPSKVAKKTIQPGFFTVPGTNHPLHRLGDFYFSPDTGLCFPVLQSLPILKSGTAIMASGLIDQLPSKA
jgi:hypothetical protein